MKKSGFSSAWVIVAIAALALPGLAAAKNGQPPLVSAYWPWEACSDENLACAAVESIDLRKGTGEYASPLWNDFTPDPNTLWTPFGITFDADGTMYTINNWTDLTSSGYSRLATIDPATGDLNYIGPVHGINIAGPEMDACGNIFATGFTVGDPADPTDTPLLFGDSYLYRFDKESGEMTPIGDTGRTDWMDLAFDSAGRLWATTDNKLYLLDPQSGAATFVTDILGVPTSDIPGTCRGDWPYMEVMSIAFDAQDVLWATAMRGFSSCFEVNSPVLKLDARNGRAKLVGYTGQVYNHGGDIDLRQVKVCHRADEAHVVPLLIDYGSLEEHLEHGDVVPGYPCACD